MRIDLTPLYRSAIGFDRLFRLIEDAQRTDMNYPPYNVEKLDSEEGQEDRYRITMAVAGFDRSELDVVSERGVLRITGRQAKEDEKRTFLHRGLATRDFEQRFQLADHVKVVSAKLDNGLLHVDLVREVPEAYRPRKIAIDGIETPSLPQLQQAA